MGNSFPDVLALIFTVICVPFPSESSGVCLSVCVQVKHGGVWMRRFYVGLFHMV